MYAVLYFFTLFVHYIVIAFLLYYFVVIKFHKPIYVMFIVWFVIWLSLGLLCNGCIFTYAEQYFAHKAWGTKETYDFTKSLLYLLIFKHF